MNPKRKRGVACSDLLGRWLAKLISLGDPVFGNQKALRNQETVSRICLSRVLLIPLSHIRETESLADSSAPRSPASATQEQASEAPHVQPRLQSISDEFSKVILRSLWFDVGNRPNVES
jgi:hypothetical protein